MKAVASRTVKAANDQTRRRRMGQISRANATPPPIFSQRSSLVAPVVSAMVIAEVTAAPDGVTVDGENEQLSPEGSPVQLKFTARAKPFWGMTVSVTVADCPELMVALEGEAARVNVGAGRLMVYVALATALLAPPLAVAIALIVSVLATEIAPLY